MMTYLSLPIDMLTSSAYLRMSKKSRVLLIDLYTLFAADDRFMVNLLQPHLYRQSAGTSIYVEVRELIDNGFIKVVEKKYAKTGFGQRVFQFVHPAHIHQGGCNVQ